MKTAVMLLLVEDDALILLTLEEALRDGGFDVVTASAADKAISILDTRISSIAALVTDIRLGSKPGGWDVARHARELNPNIPVIYMTGDSAADWPVQGVPRSVLLPKPFAGAQLITAVAQAINDVGPTLG